MTPEELMTVVDNLERSSIGYETGTNAQDRERALRYYLGERFGNEVPGRSDVVLKDVFDVVESIMPSLMNIFTSGEQVVRFAPQGEGDEEAADQESKVVNHIAMVQNDSTLELYNWIKEALIFRTSYVKAWVEESHEEQRESYEALDDESYSLLLEDLKSQPRGGFRVLNHTETPGLLGSLHNITINRTISAKRIKFEALPIENIRVHSEHRKVSLADCLFVQHVSYLTKTQVASLGYVVPDNAPHGRSTLTTIQLRAVRRRDTSNLQGDGHYHASLEEYEVRETYVRIDYDEDGVAELRRIVHIGSQVLRKINGGMANEIVSMIPIECICPIPIPHEHEGLSIADIVSDIQLIRSTLLRQHLDNMDQMNNARTAYDINAVNREDIEENEPGAPIRVNGSPHAAIARGMTAPLGASSFQTLEYIHTVLEGRTPVTRYNQGLDASSLNKTATGISKIMNASQQKIQLIARLMAPSIGRLFSIIHYLLRTGMSKEERQLAFNLNGKWVSVNPAEWRTRTDFTVNVAIGAEDRMAQIGNMDTLLAIQKELAAAGVPMVSRRNIFAVLKKRINAMGYHSPSEFFTEPQGAEGEMIEVPGGTGGPQLVDGGGGAQEGGGVPPEVIEAIEQQRAALDEMGRQRQKELDERQKLAQEKIQIAMAQAKISSDMRDIELEKRELELERKEFELAQASKDLESGEKSFATMEEDELAEDEAPDLSIDKLDSLAEEIKGLRKPMAGRVLYDEAGRITGWEAIQ